LYRIDEKGASFVKDGRTSPRDPKGLISISVYTCFRGDCDYIALEKAGVFAVQDALGRNWLCVLSSRQRLGKPPVTEEEMQALKDIDHLQGVMHEKGFANEGTSFTQVDCDNIDQLRLQLAKSDIRK